MKQTALTDSVVFTGDAIVEGHALLIEGGKVIDLVPNHKVNSAAMRLAMPELIITPTLVDCQVNGGDNLLFNNAPTAEALLKIAAAHHRYGTGYLLPTCITDDLDVMQCALVAMREARKLDSGILGIHFEGPHLNQENRGAHQERFIRPLSDSELELYKPQADETILITLAPEAVAPDQIKKMREMGCLIALGHTTAKPEQIYPALVAGATGFTHLFNAMGPLRAREPGPAGIALSHDEGWCSIIADGHHVAPEMLRIAQRAKPAGKLFLVSDAMPPSATDDPQSFMLYGEQVRVVNNHCVNHEGKLAGAAMTLAECVRYAITKARFAPEAALRMATTYPANFLGLEKTIGKLLPGYAANYCVFDADFNLTPQPSRTT